MRRRAILEGIEIPLETGTMHIDGLEMPRAFQVDARWYDDYWPRPDRAQAKRSRPAALKALVANVRRLASSLVLVRRSEADVAGSAPQPTKI